MSNTTSNWTKPIIYTPPHMSNDTAELFDALERANQMTDTNRCIDCGKYIPTDQCCDCYAGSLFRKLLA